LVHLAVSGPEELAPERLAPLLCTARYGRSLRVLALTDSTNDDAKRDAAGGAADGHVVVADGQRAGRGSHGRSWSSPTGTDLYLSIVARPQRSLAELPPLTLAVGLGVADAVERALGDELLRVEVKWPNDVWIDGKKCAGILVEATSSGGVLGSVVIGIGLNVNRTDWPAELHAGATSLRAQKPGATPLDRAAVLASLLEHVERSVDRFEAGGGEPIVSALEARLALRGQSVRCDGVEGRLLGVAPSGALRIADKEGVREVLAGRLERV
jgi:BirA family biotin operon repressor/biotin-[acetyl-CoA-carboxylase] ligase